MRSAALSLVFVAVAICPAPAQLTMLSEVTVNAAPPASWPNPLDLKSVSPAGNHAIVSFVQQANQLTVDVQDFQNPTVCSTSLYDPPLFDQYADAVYSPIYGGRLFTAHRFGGVNYLNASNPCALSNLATYSTNYSHEGLQVYTEKCLPNPATAEAHYLFYSEQHTNPTVPAGLMIYRIGPAGMTLWGSALAPERGGNALDVADDGRFCYQLANTGIAAGDVARLLVYDTANKAAPSLCTAFDLGLGTSGGWSNADLELYENGTQKFAYLALGWDGFRVVDVSTPCTPTVCSFISSPNLFVEGLTFYRKNILIISGLIRPTSGPDLTFIATMNVGNNPCLPSVMSFHPTTINVRDMKVQDGLVYLGGEDTSSTTNTVGDALQKVQIWM